MYKMYFGGLFARHNSYLFKVLSVCLEDRNTAVNSKSCSNKNLLGYLAFCSIVDMIGTYIMS